MNDRKRLNWVRLVLLVLTVTTAGLAFFLHSGLLIILALAIWFAFLIWRRARRRENVLAGLSGMGTTEQAKQTSREMKALFWFVALVGVASVVALILTALWYVGELGILFAISGGIVALTILAIVLGYVAFARRVRRIYQPTSSPEGL